MNNTRHSLATSILLALAAVAFSSSASAQNWVDQANMKVPRVEATTVNYRDDIYVFNGFDKGIKIAPSVEKYDAATKKWSIISTTSTANDSAVTHNGVIRNGTDVWIIGGRVGSHPGRVTDKVWIYNLANGKWRPGPTLPKRSAAGGAALVNNKIHWLGGIDQNANCDVPSHFVYDLGAPGKGWKDITATAGVPTPRNHFSTAVVNNIIYIMGGQFGHDACPGKTTNDTDLVHAFNPANNKWTKKASMPGVNSHSEPGTFVYKNNIYTTGGENAGSDKVWKYNPAANKWTDFKNLPASLVAPIASFVDGRLVVAGGGAPRAALATDEVRSIHIDDNPPPVESGPEAAPVITPEPTPEPAPAPAPAPAPEPKPEPAPEPGSNKPAGPTLISMEAEYFDVNKGTATHQWVHNARGDSSNDAAMITNPDQGDLASNINNAAQLGYMVFFNHPGKHYIWVRGFGDSNAAGVGNSDSLHVGLNGKVATNANIINEFPNKWTWSRHTPNSDQASINVVNAGVNMVNFWMREDGLAIDKFVITSDPNFVPTGKGPEVTDGTDNYVPPVTNTPAPVEVVAVPEPVEQVEVAAEVQEPAPVEVAQEAEVVQEAEVAQEVSAPTVDVTPNVTAENNTSATTNVDAENLTVENAVDGTDSNDSGKSGRKTSVFGASSSLIGLLALLAISIVRTGGRRIRQLASIK